MTKTLENVQVPGFGKKDLTNPRDHIQLVLGAGLAVAGLAAGQRLFNFSKSAAGADGFDIPGASDL